MNGRGGLRVMITWHSLGFHNVSYTRELLRDLHVIKETARERSVLHILKMWFVPSSTSVSTQSEWESVSSRVFALCRHGSWSATLCTLSWMRMWTAKLDEVQLSGTSNLALCPLAICLALLWFAWCPGFSSDQKAFAYALPKGWDSTPFNLMPGPFLPASWLKSRLCCSVSLRAFRIFIKHT